MEWEAEDYRRPRDVVGKKERLRGARGKGVGVWAYWRALIFRISQGSQKLYVNAIFCLGVTSAVLDNSAFCSSSVASLLTSKAFSIEGICS